MKIAPAFSTGPLGQFSSHKSVFFDRNLAQTGQLAVTGNCTVGFESTLSAVPSRGFSFWLAGLHCTVMRKTR